MKLISCLWTFSWGSDSTNSFQSSFFDIYKFYVECFFWCCAHFTLLLLFYHPAYNISAFFYTVHRIIIFEK